MKTAVCILIILFFMSATWGADKKGVSATKGIQKADVKVVGHVMEDQINKTLKGT